MCLKGRRPLPEREVSRGRQWLAPGPTWPQGQSEGPNDRHLGTPQGGPLSSLWANVLDEVDEVDKALEARG